MNKFIRSSGAPMSYLISVVWLIVAIANMAEYTTWRGNERNLAYLIGGFGFAIFFAVIGGTLTMVAYNSGVDPFGFLTRTDEANAPAEQQVQAQDMTVSCPSCGATNIRRRSKCHKCGEPLGNPA